MEYILNTAVFYSRQFIVTPQVLIPRPASEAIIDAVVSRAASRSGGRQRCTLLDLGTGSGCLAITLSLLFPTWEITAIDISLEALQITKKNIALHKVGSKVNCFQSDWFSQIPSANRFDYIICNPPYVLIEEREDNDMLEVEPAIALFPQNNSLAHYRSIAEEACKRLTTNGEIYFECGKNQFQTIATYLQTLPLALAPPYQDYARIDRVLIAKNTLPSTS